MRAKERINDSLKDHAVQAREAGRSIYVIRSEVQRQVAGWANNATSSASIPSDVSGTIQSIEDAGWTLFDTGYLFVPSREPSHMLSSANVSGSIIGIFTFRRTPDLSSIPPPPA